MRKKLVIAACLLFIVSRLFFINTEPLFFDSAGYLQSFSYPDLFRAVVSVHFPLHDGYILLFWPFYHTAKFLGANPALGVILAQIVVALLSVYAFYRVVAFISDKKTALLAVIIISLSPLFWISNVTILYEIAYIGLFTLSLFCLVLYFEKKRELFLHLSAVCFCFAFFTHMMVILWLPLVFAIAFFKSKKKFLRVLAIFIIYLFVLSQVRKFIVTTFAGDGLVYSFSGLQFGTYNSAGFDIRGILVSLRNFFIPLMRGYTSLVVVLSVISLAILLFRNRKLFVYGLLWVGPALIALQFWEAQLPGRYGILAGFGLAFLTAYLLKGHKILTGIMLVYMVFVTLPAMNLLRGEIPYLQLADVAATLPKDSLLIESHFSRRQVQDTYKGKLLSINEPNIMKQQIQKDIDTYLKNKKDVYISSAALTDPYGLYSGPYLHPITLSYAKPPELFSPINEYTLKEYKVIDRDDNLIMYKIISHKKSPYPEMKNLKYSHRRLDYYDPLLWIYKFVFGSVSPDV